METHDGTIESMHARVRKMEEDLADARAELNASVSMRESDPLKYLGNLVYGNKRCGGTYGYEYTDLGKAEFDRAQEVLDACKGDVEIAETVIVKFHIR